MPQNTNLNVSPYFDDFNENKNYHKVLFKPGFPVQARELTTLQSILQNQVEKFGRHFFKEGSQVIPGGTFYDPSYFAVKIDPNFLNIQVNLSFCRNKISTNSIFYLKLKKQGRADPQNNLLDKHRLSSAQLQKEQWDKIFHKSRRKVGF